MAAYSRVYDSRHLQADCREPGSAPEPYARQSSMGYLYLFTQKANIYPFWVDIYDGRIDLVFGMEASFDQT